MTCSFREFVRQRGDSYGRLESRRTKLAGGDSWRGWSVSKEFEQQHEATYLSGGTIKTIWEGLGTPPGTETAGFTHGIWIYRNALMHDNVSGLLASERKEELLKLIAEQQERGEDGLEEEDRWLLEVNLDDLETTSGETQAYWLLAIKAARRAYLLRRLGLLDYSNSHSEDITLEDGLSITSH